MYIIIINSTATTLVNPVVTAFRLHNTVIIFSKTWSCVNTNSYNTHNLIRCVIKSLENLIICVTQIHIHNWLGVINWNLIIAWSNQTVTCMNLLIMDTATLWWFLWQLYVINNKIIIKTLPNMALHSGEHIFYSFSFIHSS